MIEETYVQFETAQLLKRAGFPQDIKKTMFYNSVGQDYHLDDGYWGNGYARPSQSVAMRWLREDRNINIRINWHSERKMWFFDMLNIAHTYDYFESEDYHRAYEDAAEKGIQIACRYLKPKAMETKTKPLRRSLSDILDIKAKE